MGVWMKTEMGIPLKELHSTWKEEMTVAVSAAHREDLSVVIRVLGTTLHRHPSEKTQSR